MLRNWQSTHRMLIRHDRRIGHRYVPNMRARIPNELGGCFVRTNAQGFRSDIDYRQQKGSKPRILFFGDSYTAGDLCSNHERFSELVGEALGAEVYNYGLSGSGTDQQVLAFESYAKDVAADLIVFSVLAENIERIKVGNRTGINRVTGRRELIPKPYFTLDGADLTLHNVPVPTERPEVPEEDKDRFGSHVRDPKLRWVYDAVDFYRKDERIKGARKLLDPMVKKLRPHAIRLSGFQPFRDYESRDSDGWRLMEALLHRFVRAASPTPVLVVPLPTYHNLRDDVDPIFQELFEAALQAPDNGCHVASVARKLCALPRDERLAIALREDVHFSPQGHQVVANMMVDEIVERGLLPAAAVRKPVAAGKQAAAAAAAAADAPRPTLILGISGFYHNSAASLIRDGRIVAAAEEERFTRVKNDRRFPQSAVNFCLEQAGIQAADLTAVVYYDNASQTFERMLHTQAAVGERGATNWERYLPSWTQYKLHIPALIREYLKYDGLILQDSHHRSHAASAFFPSPFDDAAILTIDGVGEWATATISVGEGNSIKTVKEMRFPHSLGLLYSAFTQFTGFKVNSGEYKMMGLAPYGESKYVNIILEHLVDLKKDGSMELNMEYFSFLDENRMTNEKFAELFGGPERHPDAWISQREMDLARSIQVVSEECILRMARYAHELTGKKYLCMAGGVALNCVANGRLLREGPFEDLWIQPAAGDSGGSLGAALDVYYEYYGKPRVKESNGRSIQGSSYLGPDFSDDEIRAYLESNNYPFEEMQPQQRADKVAELLDAGKVVGHFAGRVEFGPRALGARSIIGDARNQEMQVNLNLKIKYRESFRPFAPSCLEERVSDYFEMDGPSPYMLLVAGVQEKRRLPMQARQEGESLTDVVKRPRSDMPAITHIDYSARVQTVHRDESPAYYDVIKAFEKRTGYGVIVNTSFNVRGEPIVCTPSDAYRCFMRTEMDILVLGNFVLYKPQQPAWPEEKGHVEFDVVDQQQFAQGLIDGLRDVFRRAFMPACWILEEAGAVRVSEQPLRFDSAWVDVCEPTDLARLFAIPPALDGRTTVTAGAAAEAIVSGWEAGLARDTFKPVVQELWALGQKYKPEQPFDEAVADSIYVMF